MRKDGGMPCLLSSPPLPPTDPPPRLFTRWARAQPFPYTLEKGTISTSPSQHRPGPFRQDYTETCMTLVVFLEACFATYIWEYATRQRCLHPPPHATCPRALDEQAPHLPTLHSACQRVWKQPASYILWLDRVSNQHKPIDNAVQASNFLDQLYCSF